MLVGAVRLALWVLPFRVLHRAVGKLALRPRATAADAPTAGRIAWAVSATARRVPAASCLTQALAAMILLARHGYPATLRVGVARGEQGQLRAHAWVDSDGRTLIGGAESDAFTAFPPIALPR